MGSDSRRTLRGSSVEAGKTVEVDVPLAALPLGKNEVAMAFEGPGHLTSVVTELTLRRGAMHRTHIRVRSPAA